MSDCRCGGRLVYEKPDRCPYCEGGERIKTEVDNEGYMSVTVNDDEFGGKEASLDVYAYRAGKDPKWIASYEIQACPMCGKVFSPGKTK